MEKHYKVFAATPSTVFEQRFLNRYCVLMKNSRITVYDNAPALDGKPLGGSKVLRLEPRFLSLTMC